MKVFLILAALTLSAQLPPRTDEPRLPDGRSQREEILKSEHVKSVDDAAEMMRLAEEVKIDLEKDDRHIVSVKTIRKLEEIEKLAKRVRGRLKRY